MIYTSVALLVLSLVAPWMWRAVGYAPTPVATAVSKQEQPRAEQSVLRTQQNRQPTKAFQSIADFGSERRSGGSASEGSRSIRSATGGITSPRIGLTLNSLSSLSRGLATSAALGPQDFFGFAATGLETLIPVGCRFGCARKTDCSAGGCDCLETAVATGVGAVPTARHIHGATRLRISNATEV